MKRTAGIILMFFGLLLLSGAVILHVYNVNEDEQAQVLTEYYLPKLVDSIKSNVASTNENNSNADVSEIGNESSSDVFTPLIPGFYDTEMTVTIIDGYGFVGYLSIPDLGLELPILSETDDEKLRIAPCLFYGSAKTDDLVIGAHNYSKHFGKIGDLNENDKILLTDMDGNIHEYSVISIEILQPGDVDILTNGEYDLTLYTCTYGGRTRITVRCDRTE